MRFRVESAALRAVIAILALAAVSFLGALFWSARPWKSTNDIPQEVVDACRAFNAATNWAGKQEAAFRMRNGIAEWQAGHPRTYLGFLPILGLLGQPDLVSRSRNGIVHVEYTSPDAEIPVLVLSVPAVLPVVAVSVSPSLSPECELMNRLDTETPEPGTNGSDLTEQ